MTNSHKTPTAAQWDQFVRLQRLEKIRSQRGREVRKTLPLLSVENIHFYLLLFLFYPPKAGAIQIEGAAFLLLMSE